MTSLKLSPHHNTILNLFAEMGLDQELPTSQIAALLAKNYQIDWSLRSLQRYLGELESIGFLSKTNQDNQSKNFFKITSLGRLVLDPGQRLISDDRLDSKFGFKGRFGFNFELLDALQNPELINQYLFTQIELDELNDITKDYQKKLSQNQLAKKEFERIIVEFSWKSSQIEGNTYSLLETEELLKGSLDFPNHTVRETDMILNHKKAFNFVQKNRQIFLTNLTSSNIIDLHGIITKNLNINKGLRKHSVGIPGSMFRPLDNLFVIQDSMDFLCQIINKNPNPYAKAFLVSLLIAYIQPFEDGNKRTARILCNAILYCNDLPMLPFRSVNIIEYKKAVISFYEYNSVKLYKDLFLEQIRYCVQNYF